MFHRVQNESIGHLRNSYSVITNLSTFLQNLRWSTLRGHAIRVGQVRDTLLSLMGNQSDTPSGRISPKLPTDSHDWMGTPLMK